MQRMSWSRVTLETLLKNIDANIATGGLSAVYSSRGLQNQSTRLQMK